jgi:hypothetical protein
MGGFLLIGMLYGQESLVFSLFSAFYHISYPKLRFLRQPLFVSFVFEQTPYNYGSLKNCRSEKS